MITLLKQLVMKIDIGSLPITAFDHPLISNTDKDKAMKWWNELSEEQKTMLKEEFSDILGMDVFSLTFLFTEEEIITIVHQKLFIEGILEDE